MTAFVLAAAGLTVLTIILLAVPLIRRRVASPGATQAEASVAVLRDQLAELERDLAAGSIGSEAGEAARRELKARLLEDAVPEPATSDRRLLAPVGALAVALPAAALGLYLVLGNPAALDPQQPSGHLDAAKIEAMVERLAQRLKSAPDDPEGWVMLARSYRVLDRHEDAAEAFARAETRIAADPKLLTDWAESLALARGGTLSGRPAELLARALSIDPDLAHALALAGAAAFERGEFRAAIGHWERLAKQFPAESEEARSAARSIASARAKLGAPGETKAKPPRQANISGRVSLARTLAAKAAPTDTVFIFARTAGGPPMPLAVLRKHVRDLPVEFSLDDSMAMAPSMKLSGVAEVIVGARVSRSGSATPQSGDLQGLTRPVKVGATGVAVVIDTALP